MGLREVTLDARARIVCSSAAVSRRINHGQSFGRLSLNFEAQFEDGNLAITIPSPFYNLFKHFNLLLLVQLIQKLPSSCKSDAGYQR